jgi:crotonobetainyl-CoA:carnitine CoA-transferase CaiB-like acyl-CoA transferase
MGYPVMNAHDILSDPHLYDREFWRSFDNLQFPGLFARFSDSAPPPMRPAPRLGEHNAEVYRSEFGFREAELARLREENVI